MISALTITIASTYGDDAGTLAVEWVGTDAGRQEYRYRVAELDGTLLAEGTDLRSGTGDDPDHVAMMASLLAFLDAAGENVRYGDGTDHSFPQAAAEWAAGMGDALAMARFELEPDND